MAVGEAQAHKMQRLVTDEVVQMMVVDHLLVDQNCPSFYYAGCDVADAV